MMEDQKKSSAETLFEAALDLSPARQVAFLEENCRDAPEIRSQAEQLLIDHERAGHFLSGSLFMQAEDSSLRDAPVSVSLPDGAMLGRYTIVEALGAGGMGAVYRARDKKLERDVAIKVISPGLLMNEDARRRFRNEALALARLSHPHIASVYDVGQQGGVDYLIMECISGRTLAATLKLGVMPVEGAIAIMRGVASALEQAHECGIIHRDLKPANIMITAKGDVKVLDFGIAKLAAGETVDAHGTASGSTMLGTPLYMSPEQVQGKKVDSRTDLWSLGVVIYEALTGLAPFNGEGSFAIMRSIVDQTPVSAAELRPEISQTVEHIVSRLLEKDPDLRIQSARDLLQDISLAPGRIEQSPLPADVRIRSLSGFWIAVLPFKSAGTDTDVRTMADCLSAEIVAGLSRFSYLRVIAHSLTQRYANQAPDLLKVGKELGARYVMNGDLRRAGARLRVAVQLIDTSTGAQLWSETYERPFDADSLFDLQDDLVPRIVSTIADCYGFLPTSMGREQRRKDPATLTPYEALLRSFCYSERVTPEEHAQAKAGLERAVEQAPESSDCWAMLSILFTDEYIHGFSSSPDSQSLGLQAARRAVDTNPTNHKAYQALAWALCWLRKFEAARDAGDRALALNSMDSGAMIFVAEVYGWSGGWERGCELCLRAIELNPNHPGWYRFTIWMDAYRRKDYAAALPHALKISIPGFPTGYVALACTYGKLGQKEAGGHVVRELLALNPAFPYVVRDLLSRTCSPELVDEVMDGLHKAGMEVPGDEAITAFKASVSAESA